MTCAVSLTPSKKKRQRYIVLLHVFSWHLSKHPRPAKACCMHSKQRDQRERERAAWRGDRGRRERWSLTLLPELEQTINHHEDGSKRNKKRTKGRTGDEAHMHIWSNLEGHIETAGRNKHGMCIERQQKDRKTNKDIIKRRHREWKRWWRTAEKRSWWATEHKNGRQDMQLNWLHDQQSLTTWVSELIKK